MRRLRRILSALASPAALPVVARLMQGPATQRELLSSARRSGVSIEQPALSNLMGRFEDLGLVDHPNRKAPYVLTHPEETRLAVLHIANLGLRMSTAAREESRGLQDLAHRANIELAEESPEERQSDRH